MVTIRQWLEIKQDENDDCFIEAEAPVFDEVLTIFAASNPAILDMELGDPDENMKQAIKKKREQLRAMG